MIETRAVAQTTSDTTDATAASKAGRGEEPDIGDIVDAVTTYAKQETLGKLKGAGSWLAFGFAGAVALGAGLILILLGLLRLIQTEWDSAASGRLSWLPYLIVIVVSVVLIVVTLSRISKDYLNKESN